MKFFIFFIFFAKLNTYGFPISELNQKVESLNQEELKSYQQVANQLRCPTCNGLSILQSDVAFSLQIKNALVEKVKSHSSSDEILSYFTDRYGMWILREPPRTGFHWLIWLIPSGLLLLGPAGVLFYLRRKKQIQNLDGLRSEEDILKEFYELISQLKRSI